MDDSWNFGSQYFHQTTSQQYQDYATSSNDVDEIDDYHITAPATPDPNVDALGIKLIDSLFITNKDKNAPRIFPVLRSTNQQNPVNENPVNESNNENLEIRIVNVSSSVNEKQEEQKQEDENNNENQIIVPHHYIIPQIHRNPDDEALMNEVIRRHRQACQIHRNPVNEQQEAEKQEDEQQEDEQQEAEKQDDEAKKLKERRKCRNEEKIRFIEFFNSLADGEYPAPEMLVKYNHFFHVTISPIGFGRMIEVKNYFDKSRKRYKGQSTIFYKKKNQDLPEPKKRKPRKQAKQTDNA